VRDSHERQYSDLGPDATSWRFTCMYY